jgi:hypothetical protein
MPYPMPSVWDWVMTTLQGWICMGLDFDVMIWGLSYSPVLTVLTIGNRASSRYDEEITNKGCVGSYRRKRSEHSRGLCGHSCDESTNSTGFLKTLLWHACAHWDLGTSGLSNQSKLIGILHSSRPASQAWWCVSRAWRKLLLSQCPVVTN